MAVLATDNQNEYAAREIARVVVEHFANNGSSVEFAEPQDVPQMAREVERSLAVASYDWVTVETWARGFLGERPPGREGAWDHGARLKMIHAVVKQLAKIHVDGAKKKYAVCIGRRGGAHMNLGFGIDKVVLAGGRGITSDCTHVETVEASNPKVAGAIAWNQFQTRRLNAIESGQQVLLGQVARLFERADLTTGAYGAPLTARRSLVVNDRLANDTYGYLALNLAGGMRGFDPAEMRLHLAEYFHVDPNIFRQLHPEYEPLAAGLRQIGERAWEAIVAAGFRNNNSRGEIAPMIAADIFSWLEMTLRWGRHAPWDAGLILPSGS